MAQRRDIGVLVTALAVISLLLLQLAAVANCSNQLDPLCSDCESKRCSYSKRLHCSCRSRDASGERIVEIGGDKTDREYAKVSLGFAIDDTGSMSGVINMVKATIRGVVSATAGIFDKFVLATFNDPYTYNLYQSTAADAVGGFVDRIQAHDGGDCPEMALSGISDVANQVADGSAIFVFTDASAKDTELEPQVKSLLLAKDIRLNFLATGNLCSDVENRHEYHRLANATKGSIYRTPHQWDVRHVMDYIRKYAKYGVRYVREMPRSLDDLRAVANGTCSCEPLGVQNLVCIEVGGVQFLNASIGSGSARAIVDCWSWVAYVAMAMGLLYMEFV